MNIKNYLHEEYTIKRRSQNDIAIEQNLPLSLIEYLIKKVNLNYSRSIIKYTVNENKFDEKDPIFMYYVGLIATDGYINYTNNRVCLRLKDTDSRIVLQNLINHFEYQGDLFKYGTNIEFRVTSKLLIEKLILLGIPKINKTFCLTTPNDFYSDNCLRMYLRGVHDGDGNTKRKLSKKDKSKWIGGSWRILTGSHSFIENLSKILNNKFGLNIVKTINSKKNGKEYPEIVTKQSEGKLILSWLYEGFEEFRLEDKYQKYLSII
jgi:hypothetical protein